MTDTTPHDTEHVYEDSPSAVDATPLTTRSFIGSANLPVVRQLVVALGLLVVVFGATYVGTIVALFEPASDASDVSVSTLIESTNTTLHENPFDETKITGKAAIVWDVREQRVLFNKNADEELPLASITKLMTALVAYELLGNESTVGINADAVKTDGDSGLSDGEEFSFQDLADITLIASSNDGATALGAAAGESVGLAVNPQRAFVEAMNLRAKELGLQSTHFNNATGLDVSPNEAGAYSTARDVALLMEYIITEYPDVVALTTVDATVVNNSDGEYHSVKNTNELVSEIDGIIASKTGYTELAGGNLVVAFNAGLNRPIVVVVLGSTMHGRFTDVQNLTERARQSVATEGK